MKFLLSTLLLLTPTCATAEGARKSTEVMRPTTTAEYAKTSVMIANLEQSGGGTGVVLSSYSDASYVLTNRHVCGLLVKGGSVVKGGKLYPAVAFKPSKIHDVCLVKVKSDLQVSTMVATEEPKLFSKAHISGHPHLRPHVLTNGDFSEKINIDIVMDSRPCTIEEMESHPIQCIFGGYPIVEQLEAQLVSATILPGSSGSAVFNDNGEIAGLAFASDSRELAYALVVPHAYIVNFLKNESKNLRWQYPAVISVEKDSSNRPPHNRRLFPQPFTNTPGEMYNIENWQKLIDYLGNKQCLVPLRP